MASPDENDDHEDKLLWGIDNLLRAEGEDQASENQKRYLSLSRQMINAQMTSFWCLPAHIGGLVCAMGISKCAWHEIRLM